MLNDLLVIEAQFEVLVKRLETVIVRCGDDPDLAPDLDRLRAACEKASAGAELLRQYRERHS